MITIQINEIIAKKKLTQRNAAKLLGVDQPKVSALINGKLTGFSSERLFRFLNILGQDVTITVRPVTKRKKESKAQCYFPKKFRRRFDFSSMKLAIKLSLFA